MAVRGRVLAAFVLLAGAAPVFPDLVPPGRGRPFVLAPDAAGLFLDPGTAGQEADNRFYEREDEYDAARCAP